MRLGISGLGLTQRLAVLDIVQDFVDKPVVLLLYGQSNEQAKTVLSPGAIDPVEDQDSSGNLVVWDSGGEIAAVQPLTNWPTGAGASDGPTRGFRLAQNLLAAGASKVVLVLAAQGSQSVVGGSLGVGGTIYNEAVTELGEALAANPGAVALMSFTQGERDAFLETSAAAYTSGVTSVFAGLRAVSGAADMKIFIHQMQPALFVTEQDEQIRRQIIDEAHKRLPLTIANSIFILASSNDAIVGDEIHFTAQGQRDAGDNAFAVYSHIADFNASAPAAPSAPVFVSGRTVRITLPSKIPPMFVIEYRASGTSDPWQEALAYPDERTNLGYFDAIVPGTGLTDVRLRARSFAGTSAATAEVTVGAVGAFTPSDIFQVGDQGGWAAIDGATMWQDTSGTVSAGGNQMVARIDTPFGVNSLAALLQERPYLDHGGTHLHFDGFNDNMVLSNVLGVASASNFSMAVGFDSIGGATLPPLGVAGFGSTEDGTAVAGSRQVMHMALDGSLRLEGDAFIGSNLPSGQAYRVVTRFSDSVYDYVNNSLNQRLESNAIPATEADYYLQPPSPNGEARVSVNFFFAIDRTLTLQERSDLQAYMDSLPVISHANIEKPLITTTGYSANGNILVSGFVRTEPAVWAFTVNDLSGVGMIFEVGGQFNGTGVATNTSSEFVVRITSGGSTVASWIAPLSTFAGDVRVVIEINPGDPIAVYVDDVAASGTITGVVPSQWCGTDDGRYLGAINGTSVFDGDAAFDTTQAASFSEASDLVIYANQTV